MERVLPRDAFNDGNILKSIGALTMAIEDKLAGKWTYEYDGLPFDIQQDEADGSTSVKNVSFFFDGIPVSVSRPMNSRKSWPLYILWNDETESIFNEEGQIIFK